MARLPVSKAERLEEQATRLGEFLKNQEARLTPAVVREAIAVMNGAASWKVLLTAAEKYDEPDQSNWVVTCRATNGLDDIVLTSSLLDAVRVFTHNCYTFAALLPDALFRVGFLNTDAALRGLYLLDEKGAIRVSMRHPARPDFVDEFIPDFQAKFGEFRFQELALEMAAALSHRTNGSRKDVLGRREKVARSLIARLVDDTDTIAQLEQFPSVAGAQVPARFQALFEQMGAQRMFMQQVAIMESDDD